MTQIYYNTSRNEHRVTIGKKYKWIHSEVTITSTRISINRELESLFITQSLRRVETETIKFPIYEGMLELSELFQEFEEKLFEPQRVLALSVSLKATPTRWWVTHNQCWCNCNFGMYSLVFLMYCNPMFIPGCICNLLESCHAPMFLPGGSIM